MAATVVTSHFPSKRDYASHSDDDDGDDGVLADGPVMHKMLAVLGGTAEEAARPPRKRPLNAATDDAATQRVSAPAVAAPPAAAAAPRVASAPARLPGPTAPFLSGCVVHVTTSIPSSRLAQLRGQCFALRFVLPAATGRPPPATATHVLTSKPMSDRFRAAAPRAVGVTDAWLLACVATRATLDAAPFLSAAFAALPPPPPQQQLLVAQAGAPAEAAAARPAARTFGRYGKGAKLAPAPARPASSTDDEACCGDTSGEEGCAPAKRGGARRGGTTSRDVLAQPLLPMRASPGGEARSARLLAAANVVPSMAERGAPGSAAVQAEKEDHAAAAAAADEDAGGGGDGGGDTDGGGGDGDARHAEATAGAAAGGGAKKARVGNCFVCNAAGHWASECPTKAGGGHGGGGGGGGGGRGGGRKWPKRAPNAAAYACQAMFADPTSLVLEPNLNPAIRKIFSELSGARRARFRLLQKHARPVPSSLLTPAPRAIPVAAIYGSRNGKGDAFRHTVYEKGAAALRKLDIRIVDEQDVARAIAAMGWGETLRCTRILRDYVQSSDEEGGRFCSKLDALRSDPDSVAALELAGVWGVGAVTATTLGRSHGVRSLAALRARCADDAAAGDPTRTLNPAQLVGLRCHDDLKQRIPRSEMDAIIHLVSTSATSVCPDVVLHPMGSYRRGAPTSGDLDVLITHEDDEARMDVLGALVHALSTGASPLITDSLVGASARSKPDGAASWMGVVRLPGGLHRRLDLRVYPIGMMPYALLYFTGSEHFNRSMRHFALQKGLSLSDKGLVEAHGRGASRIRAHFSTGVPARCEQDIFDALGLTYVPPAQRSV